jgi:hypothetical protein
MINKFNTSNVLSIIAFTLTILTTALIVGRCHITKNINGIYIEVVYLSLVIASLWTLYGHIENKYHILIGNIIIILLLFYLLYLYYTVV